jgi:transposase
MAHFKSYSHMQTQLVEVSFLHQILPGTFEYALHHIVDNHIDFNVFEHRYHNDETGAPAFDPAILLQIVLFAYSRGITSSRRIAQCCEENIIFKALSANTRPHFTTIADFVSSMKDEIASIFSDVLALCYSEGLIGKQMFAIDGCKLAANCSKEWSGTRKELMHKKEKFKASIKFILEKHALADETDLDPASREEELQAVDTMQKRVDKVSQWLKDNPNDKIGARNKPIKSNITDNESAKMPTSHGVIQGYTGVASVDDKSQVVVHAEAFGESQEHELLKPMIEGTRENLRNIGAAKDVFKKAKLTADSGYHSEKNMKLLAENHIDGYVADNKFRQRDPLFSSAGRYKERTIDRHHIKKTGNKSYFQPSDFILDTKRDVLICPAGNMLHVSTRNFKLDGGLTGVAYAGRKSICGTCALRPKCLRVPTTPFRQVVIFAKSTHELQFHGAFTKQMIKKFDSLKGRFVYSRRMGTVEPVFGHIRSAMGLSRFTVRSKHKVDVQWKLFCLVHNIGKLFRYAPSYAS